VSITEHQMRQHFRTAPVTAVVNTGQIIASGHRQLRARRRRRALGAVVPAALIVAAGGIALSGSGNASSELVGSGLTLAAGSSGPVQVSDDRVDLGHGLQAWREGHVVNVGFPEGSHDSLDTTDSTAQWGDMGYDSAVLDEEQPDDHRTTVVGTVRGEPSHVEVTIAGVSQTATIACFTQARGWCSYAAVLPITVDQETQSPTVRLW
jgi:hypothetical protein